MCVCGGTQGAQRSVPVSPQPPTAPRCPRTCRPPWQAPTMARKWPAEQRGQPSAVAHSRWKVQPSQVPSGHLLGTRASRTWGWLSPKPPSPGQCCVPSSGTRHYSTGDTGVAVPKVRIPSATLPVTLRCVRTGAGGLRGCSYPQPGPQLWHPPGHGGTHRVWGWQLPQQSPQGHHPPCAQGPQCLGTPGGQNLGLAPPFHATTCVPSGVTHLGTARLPVPGCSGSQRRRMVVARPPLHDCVTSLDLWWHREVGGQQGPWSPSHTPGGLAPSRPHL